MGMQSAQSAQSINQQQPGGKGSQQYSQQPQGGKGMAQPTQQMPQGSDFTAPMGGPNGQPQQYQGKGGTTNSATSGQPRMGQANPYSNTIQPWDNGNNQTQSGKGKGH
jgi:hypothetical protein